MAHQPKVFANNKCFCEYIFLFEYLDKKITWPFMIYKYKYFCINWTLYWKYLTSINIYYISRINKDNLLIACTKSWIFVCYVLPSSSEDAIASGFLMSFNIKIITIIKSTVSALRQPYLSNFNGGNSRVNLQ